MKVGGTGVDLFGLYGLAILVNLAATLLGGRRGDAAAHDAGRAAHADAGVPVLFFAPVYVPLALLQGWIHGVAVVNPITRVIEAGRGFVAGSPTEVAAAFAAAAALGARVLALGLPRPAQCRSCRVGRAFPRS